MAAAVLTPTVVASHNAASANIAFTPLHATDGGLITWSERDDKYVVLIKNVNASTKAVTIKAGNGVQGVVDMTVSLAQNEIKAVCLESGFFKNVTGANKGKVLVMSDTADVSVCVIVQP